MTRFQKILKRIVSPGALGRITYYNVDGLLLKKYRSGKIVIVYLAGKIVFNNTASNDAFGPWWNSFKNIYKGHEWKKLGRRIGKRLDREGLIDKISKHTRYDKRNIQET